MIDIHESCAQLVAAGYNAVVNTEETDDNWATILIHLNEHFDVLVFYQHGEFAQDVGWSVYTATSDGSDVDLAYAHDTNDVCEAVLAYARQVGKDARADTEFCVRHAVLEYFGWDA